MDPRLLYTDFLMDDRELLLQPTTDTEPTFRDDRGYTYCAIAVFRSDDPNLARDPLSTNHSAGLDPAFDIPVVESLSPLIISSATPPPVVDAPFRSITPNNRSLTYLQSGPFDQPQSYMPLARGGGGVSSVSLASSDLLYYVEPLPLDQLACHSADTVRS